MQKKDNRSYTFFLSHKTKTKIYSRHIQVSKNIVHTSIVGLILSLGIVSLGFFKDTVLAKFNAKSPTEVILPVQTAETVQNNPKTAS